MEDDDLQNCTAELLPELGALNHSEMITALTDILNSHVDRAQLRAMLHDCLYPNSTVPHDLPWWQKTFWSVLFGSMLLVSTTGNATVIWIVLAHRRMRTVTNYFLVNLSLSDLLMSLLNCIFNFIFMVNSHWPFGTAYCTINNFVANVTVAASVFTLVAITLDRFMAIMRPLHHRTSRRRARALIGIVWISSCLLALPCLLYSVTMTRKYINDQSRTACYMEWPDGHYPDSVAEYVYNLVFLGLTYVVPVIAMGVCYGLMGMELWGGSIGEQTQHQLDSIRSKRKVVRMFIIVVTIFSLCWLPYHGYFIYAYHYKKVTESMYVQTVYLAFYWLAMSHAMVNPLIYFWMNNRFRMYFKYALCRCCSAKFSQELEMVTGATYITRTRSGKTRRSKSLPKSSDHNHKMSQITTVVQAQIQAAHMIHTHNNMMGIAKEISMQNNCNNHQLLNRANTS
ncbi:tachykinin-like peptides receptor 86C [Lycorma delicatula]|uniref:tachykinin-like peptides receptor 86C n=1 Tax=Lycorma delicatula TaxID=130591 RepID=UPI003F516B1C